MVPAADQAAPVTPATVDPSAIKLSLADALKAAIPASELMTVAEVGVDESKSSLRAARAGWLPQLTASARYSGDPTSVYKASLPTAASASGRETFPNSWSASLSLSQTLFDGGVTSAGIAASRAGVRIAAMGVKS